MIPKDQKKNIICTIDDVRLFIKEKTLSTLAVDEGMSCPILTRYVVAGNALVITVLFWGSLSGKKHFKYSLLFTQVI